MLRSLLVANVMLLASAVPCLAQEPAPASIKWRTDYNAARKEAMEKKLPIVILFAGHGPNPYVDVLEKTVLEDKEVAKLVNAHFLPIRIEGQDDTLERVLGSALGVDAFPTMVFATHNGRILPPSVVGAPPLAIWRDRLHSVLAELSPPDWRTSKFFSRSSCWPR